MTYAPNTSEYLLVAPDSALTNYRTLAVGTGLILNPGSAQGTATVSMGGIAALLNALSGSGYIVRNSGGNTLATASFGSSSTITATNGSGIGGATTFSLVDSSSVQKINVQVNGDVIGSNSTINLVAATGIGVSGVVDNTNHRINLFISAVSEHGGTVTSVNIGSTTGLIPSGGPVTDSGTLKLDLPGSGVSSAVVKGDLLVGNTDTTYHALPVGSNGAFLTLSSGTPVWAALPTIAPTAGGTGLTTYAVGDLLYGSAVNTLAKLATSGTAHQVLTNDGASNIPAWHGGTASSGNVLTYNGTAIVWAAPAGSGTVTSVTLDSPNGTIFLSGTNPVTSTGTIHLDVTSGIYPVLITGGSQNSVGVSTNIMTSTTVSSIRITSSSLILLTIVNVTGTVTSTPSAWIQNRTSGAFDIFVSLGGATSLDVAWFLVL